MKKFSALLVVIPLLFFVGASGVHAQSAGEFLFSPDSVSTSQGQEFTTDIVMDTGGNEAGGGGAILKFNPVFLEVVNITPGIIFDDYPLAFKDNDKGVVKISGIAGSTDNLFKGKDKFASVTWRSKASGTTSVTFDFTPGSTTDSNIAVKFGNGDVLSSVGSLNVTITAGSGSAATTTTTTAGTPAPSSASAASAPTGNIFQRAISSISGMLGLNKEQPIDPYAPIPPRDPNTSIADESNASFVSTKGAGSGISTVAMVAIVLVAIVVVGAIAFFVVRKMKKKKSGTTVVQQINQPGSTPPSTGQPPFNPPIVS